MRLPDTTTSVRDLTRWNRAGLRRFRYVDGAAAEWLEYLRICHLLLYARSDKLGTDLSEVPEIWVEAFRTGATPDGTPVAQAARDLKSVWDRASFDGNYPPDANYAQILRAQYDHIGLDQTRHISRAVVRAFHILTESLDAYANECFVDTATQPEHLRMLLEMIGFRPRPAASAQAPVALMVTEDAAGMTLQPGLGFDFNPNDGGPLLAFESLDAIKVHPALNLLRPVGWDQASDPVATATRSFALADPSVLNNAVGGTYALLGSGSTWEPVRVDAVDKVAGSMTVHRYAANAQATYQQAGFRFMPSARVTTRPRGGGWIHFNAPPQAHPGQTLAIDIDTSGIVYLRLIDESWDGSYRVAELRGPDLRLSPSSLNRVTAVYPVKTSYTKSATDKDSAGNWLLIAGAQVKADELGPVGQVETLDAGRCYVLGEMPEGLVAGQPAVFTMANGGVLVGSVSGIRIETGGFSFLPSAGIAATSVTEVHAGFTVTTALAHETRSSAALFQSDGKLHVRAGDGAGLLVQGRAILIGRDPETGSGTVAAGEIEAVEQAGDTTKLTLSLTAADLPGLTRGNTILYGNTVTFGHGKTAPAKTLGSGDNSQPGQAFTIADGPLATRPDPNFPGGAALDIEIQVAGRTWRQAADLAGGDTELCYTVTLDEKGQHIVAFGQRLPSGTDNVVLTKSRIGAGARGNLLAAGRVFALKPKNAAVASIVQPLAAQFGADVEDVTALRAQGGSHFALADRALAVGDFATLAEAHSGVWHAHATLERVIGPSINSSIALTVVPAGGGSVEPIRADLTAYLLKRAAPGVAVSIRPFLSAPFGGTAMLTLRQGYARSQTVIDEIGAVLAKRFGLEARALGRTLYVTEIVSAIEAHEAVENSIFTLTPLWPSTDAPRVVTSAAGAIQAVVPHPTQSIHLPAGGSITLSFGTGV